MPDTTAGKSLRSARDLIEKAIREMADKAVLSKPGTDRGVVGKIALRHILKMIDVVIAALEAPPESDSIVVYGILAEECEPVLGLPSSDVFGALVELCGEPHGAIIRPELPRAKRSVIETIRREIVAVTVEYRARPGGTGVRIIEMLYGADRRKVRRKRIKQEIDWGDIPEEVRARIIRDGDEGVTLSLPLGSA
ncbi:hypothetical protein [Streptomyces sp. NBRC 110028]|uniref:hypothetical protein n=1 Tax=Streptomyces sp. NBRC 110028 TaxID=1621260 RepID=UPI0006E447D6|nr:hypothetical protein [Streptomyces sp. NBRC 110028]